MTAGLGDEADLSVFENKSGLAEDLKFLASMPELCDVMHLFSIIIKSKTVIQFSIVIFPISLSTSSTGKNKNQTTLSRQQVTFLVGDTREPVCAVKAVLAARSRYFL